MAQFAEISPADGDVLGRILNALYWDLAVPSDYLSVKVKEGWVTISGDVARSYQKSCAEADVRRVSGVRGVSNEIEINPNGSHATGVSTGTGDGAFNDGCVLRVFKAGRLGAIQSVRVGHSFSREEES